MIRCPIYVFFDKLLLSFFFVAKPLLRRPKSFPASVNFWFELFTCCFFRKICIVSCPSTQSHTMLCDVTFLTAFLHSHRGLGGREWNSWKIKTCEWEIIHGSRQKLQIYIPILMLKNLYLPSQNSHIGPWQCCGHIHDPSGLQVPPLWHGLGLQGSWLYQNRRK